MESDLNLIHKRFREIYNQTREGADNAKKALRKAGEIMQEEAIKDGLNEFDGGESEPMDATFCFDDENMAVYLRAKKCIEDKEVGRGMCHDEVIGWLAEHYLDHKKGEGQVYDSDEEE
jgi:hypothetical protein